MTNTKKAIIVGVSVVVLGLGIYFLTKSPKDKNNGGSGYIDEGDSNTVPVFSAKQKSHLIYEAMNQMGTDFDTIVRELTGVTQKQFSLISQAFGLQNYNSLAGYNTMGGNKRSLVEWLKLELDDAQLKLLRKKFPMYL